MPDNKNEDGDATMDEIALVKNPEKVKQGKRNKARGYEFEARVRNHLEGSTWFVAKWTNNVDLKEDRMVAAKPKFNPFRKVMGLGTGFPDFIAYTMRPDGGYRVIGVECKRAKYLDQEEREKAKWLLYHGVFESFFIARPCKVGRKILVELVPFQAERS